MTYDTKTAAALLNQMMEPAIAEDYRRHFDLRDPRNRPGVVAPVIIEGMTEGRANPAITCCDYHRRGGLHLYCR